MAELPVGPSIRKRLIVGTLITLSAIGFTIYQFRWIRSAFAGPVPTTLAALQELKDPSTLANPWVEFTFEQALDTGFVMEQTKNGNTKPKSKYLLIQIGDYWLLTDVPVDFTGNRVVGYLDTWWSPLSKKIVRQIEEEFRECDILPYQLNAEYDYRTQCYSMLGIIGFVVFLGLWIIWKALSDRRK